MTPRSTLERLSSELSEALGRFLEDEKTIISQSVIHEEDFAVSIDGEDYFLAKFSPTDSKDSSDGEMILIPASYIEKSKALALKHKSLLPGSTVLVSHRLDLSLDNIKDMDDLQKEREDIDGLLLDTFSPMDFLRMFVLSLFK